MNKDLLIKEILNDFNDKFGHWDDALMTLEAEVYDNVESFINEALSKAWEEGRKSIKAKDDLESGSWLEDFSRG